MDVGLNALNFFLKRMVKVDGEVEELRVGFERFRWCLGVSFFFFIGIDEYVVVF